MKRILFILMMGCVVHVQAQSINPATIQDVKLLYAIQCDTMQNPHAVQIDTLAIICDDHIQLWNLHNFELVHTLLPRTPAYNLWFAKLALSPDVRYIAEWGYEDNVYLWDTHSGTLIGEIPITFNEDLRSWAFLRFSADSQQVVTWRSLNAEGHNQLEVWNLQPFQQVTTLTSPHGFIVEPFLSPDTTQVTALTKDGFIEQWDVASGDILQTLPLEGV